MRPTLRPGPDGIAALIEVLFAAAWADGGISDAERSLVLERLRSDPMFHGLDRSWIEATGARAEAKFGELEAEKARQDLVESIAARLPSRGERVAAFTLAWEVCSMDGRPNPHEVTFLECLQNAVFLTDQETEEIVTRAASTRGVALLEQQLETYQGKASTLLDAMALMACADGVVDRREREIVIRMARQIGECSGLSDTELREAVNHAIARVQGREGAEIVRELAEQVPGGMDRFWITVYAMVVMRADGYEDWSERRLLAEFEAVFALEPAAMERAAAFAQNF